MYLPLWNPYLKDIDQLNSPLIIILYYILVEYNYIFADRALKIIVSFRGTKTQQNVLVGGKMGKLTLGGARVEASSNFLYVKVELSTIKS